MAKIFPKIDVKPRASPEGEGNGGAVDAVVSCFHCAFTHVKPWLLETRTL